MTENFKQNLLRTISITPITKTIRQRCYHSPPNAKNNTPKIHCSIKTTPSGGGKIATSILAVLILVLSAISQNAIATTQDVATPAELIAAIENNATTVINITANIELTDRYNNTDNALPLINSRTLTINGVGENITISRSSSATTNFRFFETGSNGNLILNNLTLTGGYLRGSWGGAVFVGINTTFTATNCTFKGNSVDLRGGAIRVGQGGTAYLFHCTFDGNTGSSDGNGISIFVATVHSYNSIFVGATPQIGGTLSGGSNLIQGVNGLTRAEVFNNDGSLACDGIVKTAPALTKNAIVVPNHLTQPQVLALLAKDQAGKKRPKRGNVTYGALEDCVKPQPFKGNIIVRGGATLKVGK